MENSEPLRVVLGVGLIVAPAIWYWWEIHRTRNWPETTGRVIEIDPQSLFEKTGDDYTLDLDSDYAIEYEVDGKRYVKTPDIENNVRFSGIKVARGVAIPPVFSLRYDPNDPNQYSIGRVHSRGAGAIGFFVCACFGLYMLFGSFE